MVPTRVRRATLGTPVETASRQLQKHAPPRSLTANAPAGPLSLRTPSESILVGLVRSDGADEAALTAATAETVDIDGAAARRGWCPVDAVDLLSDRTFLQRATTTERS